MDIELGLDYVAKHFDKWTACKPISGSATMMSETAVETPWQMLIVDGHSSHVARPVVEYAFDHRIILYCLPPHSTNLMQPLDFACFGPLARAYRTALQDFIYKHPGRSFGKQEFWDCLCIARDTAMTKASILSGFEAAGIWPFCPEVVIDRTVIQEEP